MECTARQPAELPAVAVESPVMAFLGIDVGGSSIKVAAMGADGHVWTNRSAMYADPSFDDLTIALRQALVGRTIEVGAIGLCVPGILSADHSRIEQSVNLPKLNGQSLVDWLADAMNCRRSASHVINDTTAAACDLYANRRLQGRLFLMVLGTGVGVCVMDPAGPLRVDGDSPGHFGQLDVSLAGDAVVGPDGGAGSLEGYIGAAALRSAYGADDPGGRLRVEHPAGQALVRAIRIAHAIYRPQHVILAGGVGNRLGHRAAELRQAVNHRLTSIARADWTLSVGEDDFHAARGAARWAAQAAR